jgi:hypothetical protein
VDAGSQAFGKQAATHHLCFWVSNSFVWPMHGWDMCMADDYRLFADTVCGPMGNSVGFCERCKMVFDELALATA